MKYKISRVNYLFVDMSLNTFVHRTSWINW